MQPGGIILTDIKFSVMGLVKLQMVDSIVSRKVNEINNAKKNEELASKEKEFIEFENNLDLLNKKYNELENKRKKMEDSVGMQSEKIKRNEQKLFSGTIVDAKELLNLQEEVKSLKKSDDKIEDQMLELMIKIDDLLKEIKDIQKEKEKLEVYINNIKKDVSRHVELLEKKIGDLKEKRNTIVSNIPEDYLNKYEELKSKKSGVAISVFKDNFCSVCNMKVSASDAEKINDLDKIYKCPSCGRMIVIYRDEIEDIKAELES